MRAPTVSPYWYSSQQDRDFYRDLVKTAPLLFLHNLLDGLEARIIDRLVYSFGEEYGRALWDRTRDVEGNWEIRNSVERIWLENWTLLFSYVASRDQEELKSLLAERDSSVAPEIAQLIAEAIEIEKGLP